MKIVLRLLFAAALALGAPLPLAHAQALNAVVVASCGTPPQTYTAGQFQPVTIDTTGKFCSNTAGSGGGATTAAVGSYQDGFNPTIGTTTDAPCTVPTSATGCSLVALGKATANTAANPLAAQAASVIIGGVGVPSWAGGTLGAMANYGTSPGAVLVPGVNASVTASALPTGAATAANQILDPCSGVKSFAPFSITASGASVITASGSLSTYICKIDVTTSTAASFSLDSGTGSSVCTGGTPAPVYGNSAETAANGMALAATGGLTSGNGLGSIAKAGASQNVCILITTTNSPTVAGQIAYVQQ